MDVQLDTQAFLWWILGDPKLSATARAIIADPANRIFISSASAWEIVIKFNSGKLTLPEPPLTLIPRILQEENFLTLPISMAHALKTQELPLHHKDPFDRIIIAQAIVEGIPIVSVDTVFAAYPVQVIW